MPTSCPSNRIRPLSAVWVPATHFTSVDLPAPLSPTSAITSPARTSKSTSSSACTEPNVFVMLWSWRSGVSLIDDRCWARRAWWGVPAGTPHHLTVNELLAVLLVLPDAHLAPLQPALLEEL